MTEQSNHLRFDIFERVQLPEDLASIEELEEIELVPHMQTVPSGDNVQIRGHLLLTGAYRSRSERSPIRQLEHWIPIEISLPLQRVSRMDDLRVDVEQFDVDLLPGRTLNVTGTLVLRGMKWPASAGPVWQDDSLKVVHQAPKAAETQDDLRGAWPGVSGPGRPPSPEWAWDLVPRANADAGDEPAPAHRGESGLAHVPERSAESGGGADAALFRDDREAADAGSGGAVADEREPERTWASEAWPEPLESSGVPRRDGREGAVPEANAATNAAANAESAGSARTDASPGVPEAAEDGEAAEAAEAVMAEAADAAPPAAQATAAAPGRQPQPEAEPAAIPAAPNPGVPPEMKVTLTGRREPAPADPSPGAGLLSRIGAQAEQQERAASDGFAVADREPAAASLAAESAAVGAGTPAGGEEPASAEASAGGAPTPAGEDAGSRTEEAERPTSGDELEWARLFRNGSGEAAGFRKVRLCIVQRDDTLDAIAERYRVQVHKLQQTNGLSGPYVTEGQVLVIP